MTERRDFARKFGQHAAPDGERLHVAIIMDGNGRWATRRRRPRSRGHRRGSGVVRPIVEAAAQPELGIGILTLYAFSSDNWARPPQEVAALMTLLEEYLARETPHCVENGIRLQVIGRRDRIPAALVEAIEAAEAATAEGRALTLRLAIDYSGRDAILRAAARALSADACGSREAFSAVLGQVEGCSGGAPDVDLLIRTGGEQRLSDFLLWECAYAELYFTPTLWPDFTDRDLREAVVEFRRRDRRFGRVLDPAV